MADLPQEAENGSRRDPTPEQPSSSRLLPVSALLVLALALGAVLWPTAGRHPRSGDMLVYDSTLRPELRQQLYEPLAEWLAELTDIPLNLQIVSDRAHFAAAVDQGADFVFCPDGLALELAPAHYRPLVAARRSAPRNLRPRSVLLRRLSAEETREPWLTHPSQTAFGDSVSLTGIGVLRSTAQPLRLDPSRLSECTWGPDPYSHAPVLHAARLGCYDYVVVRQWDAERFFDAGLLSYGEWDERKLTIPVPDIVLMVTSDLSTTDRLSLRETLVALGRSTEPELPRAERVLQGLTHLGLAGFNILLEPDLLLASRSFNGNWLETSD